MRQKTELNCAPFRPVSGLVLAMRPMLAMHALHAKRGVFILGRLGRVWDRASGAGFLPLAERRIVPRGQHVLPQMRTPAQDAGAIQLTVLR